MSTRSIIGIETETGIKAIYCHWDGYPSNNGKLLLEHYTDPNKVMELSDLGALSFLRKEIGEKHNFANANKEHPDWTCAFHRDRGDDFKNYEVRTRDEFLEIDLGTEFWYLFNKDNKWMFSSYSKELTVEDFEVVAGFETFIL